MKIENSDKLNINRKNTSCRKVFFVIPDSKSILIIALKTKSNCRNKLKILLSEFETRTNTRIK